MSFEDALALQPQWVQIWIMWMGIAILTAIVVLLFSQATRRDALVILATNIGVYFAMMWLYEQVGYVRLLGIVHLIFWTPLVVYLWWRLKDAAITAPFRQIMWIFLATMVVSLMFDTADVVRYLLGERDVMTG